MRSRRADIAVGCGVALAAAAVETAASSPAPQVVGAAVIGGALGLVRSAPRAAWIVAAVALAATGPFMDSLGGAALALVPAHAFFAGRRESRIAGWVALVCLIGAWMVSVVASHDSEAPAILLPGACWGAGRALRQREIVAEQLAERVRELEEEREAHAALSVRYERARIASELHDIVAHAISVMVVQASAGQRLAAHDPESTAEAFEAISGAAKQAEEDMGRLVRLLGDRDATGPAPDLALVEELVARAAGSGLDVTLRLEGERENLSPDVGHVAYRVVQEGVTNALRYASGAAVTVSVRGKREGLDVAVENGPAASDASLAGSGTGSGLRGLRERASACGGAIEAGPTGSGGWLLRAWLPYAPAASSSA